MTEAKLKTNNTSLPDRLFPDRTLGVIGGISFLIVAVIYLRTVAPTVSFWDCGEFITCSYTLGIPHPPGSPLYVLIGRIFSLLPTGADIAYRVNILSSISLAFAALVAFFVLARLITWWSGDRYPDPSLPLGQRLAIYAGSFCGTLMFAFASTNWANAVEAEVYGLSMLLMMILIWLTLVWVQRREEPGSDRYLIAIAYLSILSVSVHLTTFMVMPPLFLLVISKSARLRRDWRFWVSGGALFTVTIGVVNFLVASLGWMVITGLAMLASRPGRRWTWGFPCALVFVALLGFSVHTYIPIRSTHDPGIDQNDPETWEAFKGFVERKQYGQKSMFERALTRRGQWENQFGQHRRMGFWGFFDQQYGFNDRLFIPLFLLGLLGLGQMIRRRRAVGVFILLMLLLSSVGLVWYMNFADGTKYNPATDDAYLEVRDRDYFFTPAFILFGLAIGLGGAALIRWLGNRGPWPVAGAIIIAALPMRTIMANYDTHDNSRNYIPYDYAYNILMTADPGAILFTNGDNDTFPVWCLQQVYGIRPDVRIANLSLLNTHWYIHQLKDRMNVPMTLTDLQIDRLVHYRNQDGKVQRIQDQMIDAILSANNWREPINFAATVSASNRKYQGQSLDGHLQMIGMGYRLVREKGGNMVDLELLDDRLSHVFQYRGLNDPTLHKDANTHRLVANYVSTFLVAADTLRRAGDYAGAERFCKLAIERMPDLPNAYSYLAQMYPETGRRGALDTLLEQARQSQVNLDEVERYIGLAYRRLNDTTKAIEVLEGVLERNPRHEAAYRTLVQLYYEAKKYTRLEQFMEDWHRANPADQQSEQLLRQVRELTARLRAGESVSDTATTADTL